METTKQEYHATGGGWNRGKGKGWTNKRGYRQVNVLRDGVWGPMREHRYVMEQHLGRRLEPWELVRHKNEITTDNRIENLEIKTWPDHTKLHHTGTRKDREACKRIEAFALMRGELARVRALNSELFEALKRATRAFETLKNQCDEREWREDWQDLPEVLAQARAALAKASGRERGE